MANVVRQGEEAPRNKGIETLYSPFQQS